MKLIKLGVEIGVVWAIASWAKTLTDGILSVPLGKAVVKLQEWQLNDLEKKFNDNEKKIKTMEEIRNAKKEKSAEKD